MLTIGDRHWQKVAATFEKTESANSLPFAAHFHRGAYKRNVVVVIKTGAYIHGVLTTHYCHDSINRMVDPILEALKTQFSHRQCPILRWLKCPSQELGVAHPYSMVSQNNWGS